MLHVPYFSVIEETIGIVQSLPLSIHGGVHLQAELQILAGVLLSCALLQHDSRLRWIDPLGYPAAVLFLFAAAKSASSSLTCWRFIQGRFPVGTGEL